jgi:hypothetical protein
MKGQVQWSAAFVQDGFCTITATLHLWNRSAFFSDRFLFTCHRLISHSDRAAGSSSDKTFSVTVHLFPPPREDVELQDPSAAK